MYSRLDFKPVPTRALASLVQALNLPRLITVSAPAGYGKSVLLAQLSEALSQRGEHCVWLNLASNMSPRDGLEQLLREALRSGGLPQATVAWVDGPDAILPQPGPEATTVFIDQLDRCQDPQLSDWLHRLVFSGELHLRVVLASRHAIPFDLVRAKLELGAITLGTEQLRLDRLSIARMFAEAGLPPLADADLSLIAKRTEGWPAAVRLLQLQQTARLAADPDATRTSCQISGDHPDIAQLIDGRVLSDVEPPVRQFMLELALVDEIHAELAQQMTGHSDARAWLGSLISRQVLIFPLDHDRRRFRFHPLLLEFLQAEGRDHLNAGRRRQVLAAAAAWQAAQGHDDAAIVLALQAREVALCQSLLDRLGSRVAGDQGRMAPFVLWVEQLVAIGGRPTVETQGWYVWALCNHLQYEQARIALDSLDARVRSGESTPTASRAQQRRQAFLRIVVNLYLDRLADMHEGAMAWLASDEPHDALSNAVAAGMAGLSEIDLGALADAREHLEQGEAAMQRVDSSWVGAWIAILWACLELAEGRPAAADQRLRETRTTAARALGESAPVVATIDFVHARALLDLGRPGPARTRALQGLVRAMHHGVLLTAELGLSACAALWNGGSDDALSPAEIKKVGYSYPPRLHRFLAASRIRRCLQLGRHEEARRLAARCRLDQPLTASGHDAALPARGDWLLATIELQIALGEHDAAWQTIEIQLRETLRQGRHRDRVELLLAAVELHLSHGHEGKAVRSLALAISAAAPGKLLQPFVCRERWLAPLLGRLKPQALGLIQPADLAQLERLQACWGQAPFRPAAVPGTAAGAGVSPEAPSEREWQVLDLLNQGLNNQQIADRLTLSLATVKWHLRNLYAKLAVRSRSAALAKARSLNLLQR